MDIKLKIISEEYPSVESLSFNSSTIYISISPLANCQTFTIGNSGVLNGLNQDELRQVIDKLVEITGKKQCIIDIYQSMSKSLMEKLKPFLTDFKSIKYINGTGNPMELFLLFLL